MYGNSPGPSAMTGLGATATTTGGGVCIVANGVNYISFGALGAGLLFALVAFWMLVRRRRRNQPRP
jgi:LPXTG-motif cell wall-anchored protein